MGVGLVRKGGTGSVVHSQGTPTLALRDTYGSTYSIIKNGYLTLNDFGSVPTTPATGSFTFFAKDRAGKVLPAVVGPSGVDFNLQPALYGNTTYVWLPGATTTLAINWGVSWIARNNLGAQSRPVKTSTNQMTSLNRHRYSTTTAANSSSGVQTLDTIIWRGNSTGLGGFFYFARFGVEAIGTLTGFRVLLGLSSLNGLLSVDPSGINNTIAIIKDATDTTWQLLIRNTATLTKRNTLVTVTANKVLDIYIHVKQNDNAATFELRDPVLGSLLYKETLTTGMLGGADFLYAHCQVQTTTTTLTELALNQIYIETDL